MNDVFNNLSSEGNQELSSYEETPEYLEKLFLFSKTTNTMEAEK